MILQTVDKLKADLEKLSITVKLVGSLIKRTRTNLYSKPTLDLQISSEIKDPFLLRTKVVEQLQLTTAEIRIRDPEALLSERYPCVIVEDN